MAIRPQLFISLLSLVFLLTVSPLFSVPTLAQQPFLTDDADVTPRHHFHFEFSNEFDLLQRSAFPTRKQNTADLELDYGLFENFEIGIAVPVLSLINAQGTTPRVVSGVGDANASLKFNFLKERENSRLPALAIGMNLELPTGDTSRQLGSGLMDFYVNGILQKTIRKGTILRLNGGVLFSGNETTGVIGIRARGTVFTAGASVTRQVTPTLLLGGEVTGATSRNLDLGKGQLQGLFGGNYQLKRNLTLDFAVIAGKYAASPRFGVQLGFSMDW